MRRRALELLPWLALAAVWATFVVTEHGGLYAASDDAYIYLGYVKRALGEPAELFSYNPGEHSAGITGMLYYYVLVGVCGAVRALAGSPRIESDLLLGAYLGNAGLLLLAAWLYLRCWRRLLGDGVLSLACAFLLFCAQPKWLWAVFAGLEGPLAGVLVLALAERLLARAPAWQASVAAALLVTTRPETMLVAFALPLLATRAEGRRPFAPRLAFAYAAASATLALLVLPCWVLTGRVFPSSLGTRVHLTALLEPGGVTRYLERVLSQPAYWQAEWWTASLALLLAGAVVGLRTGRWTIARLAGCVLAFLLLRVGAGLAAFSVEDRYVSYLWPLYAVGIGACLAEALRCAPSLAARLAHARAATWGATLLAYAVAALLPIRDFVERTGGHVAAMNAIVVEPSRVMRARLPASARICMEPAGAIRVFTDFYLVDAIGLTTQHARSHAGNFPDFLDDHRVGWVFDRPDHVGELLLASHAARDVARFAPHLPWGDLHLYQVDLAAAVRLVRLSTDPPAPGRPRAVFDNNTGSGWNRLVGGGPGFARGHVPRLLDVVFAEPVRADGLVLSLSRLRSRGDAQREAERYRFEVERGERWEPLATERPRIESFAAGRGRVRLSFREPAMLGGIRVVWEEPNGTSLDELTLWHRERPYTWLWDDAIVADP